MANRWQRGYWRDDNYTLLIVDEASAVSPKRRQGYLIDASNRLVTSTVVAGSKMSQGHLRRPSGALVVLSGAPIKFRQGLPLGANNELCILPAPQGGSGIRQGESRVLGFGALLAL